MAVVSLHPAFAQPDVCFTSQQCIDELNLLDTIKDHTFPRLVSEADMYQLVQQHIRLEMNTLRVVFGRSINEPIIQIGRIGGRYYVTLTGIASMHTETFII